MICPATSLQPHHNPKPIPTSAVSRSVRLETLPVDPTPTDQSTVQKIAKAMVSHGFHRNIIANLDLHILIGSEAVAALRYLQTHDHHAFSRLCPDGEVLVHQLDVTGLDEKERVKRLNALSRQLCAQNEAALRTLVNALLGSGCRHRRGRPGKNENKASLTNQLKLATGEPLHRLRKVLPEAMKTTKVLKLSRVETVLIRIQRFSPEEQKELLNRLTAQATVQPAIQCSEPEEVTIT